MFKFISNLFMGNKNQQKRNLKLKQNSLNEDLKERHSQRVEKFEELTELKAIVEENRNLLEENARLDEEITQLEIEIRELIYPKSNKKLQVSI
ncbi:hypothetical protein [Clostridium akagii]|uniref:hypothetical protein n=1 Tax=Clostridium akagii TaxID=91623 RepID=UPI00047A44A4|nr:hypothetical protein [Clostridium akagii]